MSGSRYLYPHPNPTDQIFTEGTTGNKIPVQPHNLLHESNIEHKKMFATLRLCARKAFGDSFDQLESYALYCFNDDFFWRSVRTAPTKTSGKVQRQQLYCEGGPYDQLKGFPQKPKAETFFLVTKYGSENGETLEFVPTEIPSGIDVIVEMLIMNIENIPIRLKSKKSNLVREAARETL